MDDEKLSCLGHLCQLDIDAYLSYKQAVEHIDVVEVKKKLDAFMEDHRRHVEELSSVLRDAGQEPPTFNPDAKGVVLKGMTFAASFSNRAIMTAMRMNEKMTNHYYEKALSCGLSGKAHELIVHNREEERRHLEYMEAYVSDHGWMET